MRILVLSPYLPHRNVGHGGGVAVRGLLTYLARRHEVTLISLVRPGEKELADEVRELGVDILPLPFVDHRARGAARLELAASRAWAGGHSVFSRYPYYVQKYWSRRHSRQLLAAVERIRPDAIQIEYLQLALYGRDLWRWREARSQSQDTRLRPYLVLNTHELGSLPRRRRADAASHRWRAALLAAEAAAWDRLQRDATEWVDCTVCVTDQDRALLEQQGGVRCRTVPLGVDTAVMRPVWQPCDPPRLLFVGSFGHRPNRTAAQFLVDNVWPAVAPFTETGQLVLAGRGSDGFLAALVDQPQRIRALGFVKNLTALYRECRLFVAPLAEGGGIKIKILEAMAHGIPVVTTPIGVEGICNADEEAVWIADSVANFAEATLQALQAPAECQRRAVRARQIIEKRFSWSVITEELTSIYEGR